MAPSHAHAQSTGLQAGPGHGRPGPCKALTNKVHIDPERVNMAATAPTMNINIETTKMRAPAGLTRWQRYHLALVMGCAVALGACGGGGGSSGQGEAPPPAGISAEGGEVSVTDPASPIRGTKLSVPQGAIANGNVQFQLHHVANPAPLPSDVASTTRFVGPTVEVTADRPGGFEVPAVVTLPYDKASLPSGDPVVLAWNEETKSYASASVTQVDGTAGQVQFLAMGAGQYVAAAVRAFQNASDVTTSFTPQRDGWFIRNFGNAYGSQDGDCVGMVVYAQWYHERYRNDATKRGLYEDYRQGDRDLMADDINAIEISDRLQLSAPIDRALSSIYPHYYAGEDGATLAEHQRAATDLMAKLRSSRQPVALVVFQRHSKASGHHVLVYGYSASDGTFLVYDPNIPGKGQTLRFPQSSNAAFEYSGGITVVKAVPVHYSSFFSASELQRYHDEADRWSDSKGESITLTSPTVSRKEGRSYAEVNPVGAEGQVFAGQVSSFKDEATGAVVFPKKLLASFNGIDLQPDLVDGRFSFSASYAGLFKLLQTPDDVELTLIAYHDECGLRCRWFGSGGKKNVTLYGAFKRVTLVKRGALELRGVWNVVAPDSSGVDWAGSRLVLESQRIEGDVIHVGGYAYLTRSGGYGRINGTGTFSTTTGQFKFYGDDVVAPSRRVASVSWDLRLGTDRRSFVSGEEGTSSYKAYLTQEYRGAP